MKKLLIKLVQFVVFAAFTFAILVYGSALLLLPLGAVDMLIDIMGMAGLKNHLIGAGIAIPVVAYVVREAFNTPGLVKLMVEGGIDLLCTAKTRVEAFNELVEEVA